MPVHIFLLLLIMGVLDVSGATELGKTCKRDRDCVGSDPNLRCFGKPGFLRCACKHAWRPLAGRCRGPKGEGGGHGEGGGGGDDLVSILAPGILMGSLVLLLSLFCCFQVNFDNLFLKIS